MLTDIIDNYGVYDDIRLRKYIYDLEKRFPIHDKTEPLRQLVNFSENRDVPYHGWFKYREGFSYTLIKKLLNKSGITENEYVLDPFCGSGTTVVEAALNGYCGIGIDINPVSAFISEVKCMSYTDREIARMHELTDGMLEISRAEEISDEYVKKYEEVKKFFNAHNYQRLLAIRQVIDSKKESEGMKIYKFLLCAYICIAEEVSDRKRDGNGLKTQASKVNDVEQFYVDKLEAMIADIENHRISENIVSILACGNAMMLSEIINKYADKIGKTLGAIIYSPPYVNSFDYFESYKMEMILADYAKDMKGINKYRQQAVESFVGRTSQRIQCRDFVEQTAQEIENAIPEKEKRTGKRDSRTRKVPGMIKGYFTDMEKVIAQSASILAAGKQCYIVVDQSAYLGRIIPTDLFLAAIAEYYNFTVKDILVCRIAKTSGQQVQHYPYLNKALRESIVVLEKK